MKRHDRICYPWKQWMSRRKLVLVQGRDYKCKSYVMAQQCRNAANRAGVRLSIRIGDKVLTIVRREAT